MSFSDHFSSQSDAYSLYRPAYPSSLFEYLASVSPTTELAWDCATGNGQAALGLSEYFTRVIATDVSPEQINNAKPHEKIKYHVGSAEQSGIKSQAIDLLVVAQALHWFNFELFYEEAKRVLKREGILAVISYQLPRINTDINAIIDEFHHGTLGQYWPAERQHVDYAYAGISFPLQEIPSPTLIMEHDWTLDQFLGYLRSWSAVVYFEEEQKQNPIELIRKKLTSTWKTEDQKMFIQWPLTLRVGKFEHSDI